MTEQASELLKAWKRKDFTQARAALFGEDPNADPQGIADAADMLAKMTGATILETIANSPGQKNASICEAVNGTPLRLFWRPQIADAGEPGAQILEALAAFTQWLTACENLPAGIKDCIDYHILIDDFSFSAGKMPPIRSGSTMRKEIADSLRPVLPDLTPEQRANAATRIDALINAAPWIVSDPRETRPETPERHGIACADITRAFIRGEMEPANAPNTRHTLFDPQAGELRYMGADLGGGVTGDYVIKAPQGHRIPDGTTPAEYRAIIDGVKKACGDLWRAHEIRHGSAGLCPPLQVTAAEIWNAWHGLTVQNRENAIPTKQEEQIRAAMDFLTSTECRIENVQNATRRDLYGLTVKQHLITAKIDRVETKNRVTYVYTIAFEPFESVYNRMAARLVFVPWKWQQIAPAVDPPRQIGEDPKRQRPADPAGTADADSTPAAIRTARARALVEYMAERLQRLKMGQYKREKILAETLYTESGQPTPEQLTAEQTAAGNRMARKRARERDRRTLTAWLDARQAAGDIRGYSIELDGEQMAAIVLDLERRQRPADHGRRRRVKERKKPKNNGTA